MNINGTNGNDTLPGTAGADEISGLGGNDLLNGVNANDTLLGGVGNDVLVGGQGNDILNGGAGLDDVHYYRETGASGIYINAVAGTVTDTFGTFDTFISVERIFGSTHDDTLEGSPLGDYFNGWDGNDALRGFGGNDTLIGGRGDDTIDGGGGGDDFVLYYLDGGSLGVTVNLETGFATDSWGDRDRIVNIERVYGTELADTLLGTSTGAEYLFGREGNDNLNGLGGDDTLIGDQGNDTINGGGGTDIVSYDLELGSHGVTVDLLAGTATDTWGNSDRLESIEYVRGTELGDRILGSNVDGDRIFAGAGDDTIDGRDGKNLIFTGSGDDRVTIGTTALDARDTISINGDGNKTIVGTGSLGTNFGHHLLFALDDAVTVNLRTGIASSANMTLDFTAALHFLEVGGTAFDDHIIGGNPRHDFLEWFNGNQGNDTIDGGGGNRDTIIYDPEARIGYVNPLTGVREFGQQGIVTNLETGVSTDAFGYTDTLINIVDVRATLHADVIVGSSEGNFFWGLEGNDTMNGAGGTDAAHYEEDALYGGFAGITADLVAGTVVDGFGFTDQLISIEDIYATGADDVVNGNNVDNRLTGYGGDDLFNGLGGSDILLGGDGNDTLNGGSGDDEIWGSAGADSINGGAGDDLVLFRDATGAVAANLTAGIVFNDGFGTVDSLTQVEHLHGSDFSDILIGDGSSNRLFGFDGNDSLTGFAGNDVILGQQGNDSLLGGDGDDEMWGQAGDDTIDGGAGSDLVRFREATTGMVVNLFLGSATGEGRDVLRSIERVDGSDFDDDIFGTLDANTLIGFAGDDTLDGLSGNDVLAGGLGGDTYHFGLGYGADVINDLGSNVGTDTLYIRDYLSHNATIRQQGASQNITLGFGITRDALTLADNMTVGSAGGIEQIIWGDGTIWSQADLIAAIGQTLTVDSPGPRVLDDILNRTPDNETIDALDGNDIVRANGGDDSVFGNAGNDLLEGGDGNDTLDGGTGTDTLDGGFGDDRLIGGADADTLRGSFGDDTLIGDQGDDRLEGGDGADVLNGGDGDDFIFGGASDADLRDIVYAGEGNDSVDGGHGNDSLFGGGGDDTIAGSFGADTVIGNDGDDVLTGSAFSDLIFGNDGNDFINGGFGFDRVNGGAGGDRFFHLGTASHGFDWIQDYTAADGDVLFYGGGAGSATADDFLVQFAGTGGAGADGVNEAFVRYIPTQQVLWALIDGQTQGSINIQIGGEVFDLLA